MENYWQSNSPNLHWQKTEAQAIAHAWTQSERDSTATVPDHEYELWWSTHEQWLFSRGYNIQRRPRKSKVHWGDSKTRNFFTPRSQSWTEAIRIDDNETVYLKMTSPDSRSEEYAINEHLARPIPSPEPLNHCLKPLEILESPSIPIKILVLPAHPLLDLNKLKSIADVVDFLHQLIEGIIFLHQLHIAYGGCRLENIVVETSRSYDDHLQRVLRLTPSSTPNLQRAFSPTPASRRYLFIDFSRSRGYQPNASDMDFPDEEIKPQPPNDFFSADVYDLGMLIKGLVDSREGLDFMRPLITDMTQDIPSQRPKAADVMFRFEAGNRFLDRADLQLPIIPKNSSFLYKLFRSLLHRWHSATPTSGVMDPSIPIFEPWSGSNSEDSSPSNSSQSSGPRIVTLTIKGKEGTPQLPNNVPKLRRRPPVPEFRHEDPGDETSTVQLKSHPTRRRRLPKTYIIDVPITPDCVVHLNTDPYTKWNCGLCGCNITNKREFVRHTRSKHPDAPVCGCGKLYSTFEELQSHQKDYAHTY